MRQWFAAVLAGLLIVAGGTALASIPDGGSTDFSVSDPAVGVIASGGGGGAGGSYESGTTFFMEQPESMTVAAASDGVCLVTLDGQVLRNSGNGAKIQYGVAVETLGGEGPSFVGKSNITTTLGDFSGTNDAADLGRTALVPVKKGETYVFGFGVVAPAVSSGTTYANQNYVCFG
jgi:hypothetical protein